MICYFKQKTTLATVALAIVTAGLLASGNMGLAYLAFFTSLAALAAYVWSFLELCHGVCSNAK